VVRPPAFASGACRITAAASAILCGHGAAVAIQPRCDFASRTRLTAFIHSQVGAPLACAPPFRGRPAPGSFKDFREWVERTITGPSPHSGVVSKISCELRYGMRLRSTWRCGSYRLGEPMCSCEHVYSTAWRAARWSFVYRQDHIAQLTEHACHALFCARSQMPCTLFSNKVKKNRSIMS